MPASRLDLIVREFSVRYLREIDFYREVARRVAVECEIAFEKNGIRAIVTHRAKRLDSLSKKIYQRDKNKNYSSVEEIYKDIVDLAGVRVALYFPSDFSRVDSIIKGIFNLVADIKTFPESGSPIRTGSYQKRFSGYWATHYRVALKYDPDNAETTRYTYASIEIQVASVLMHAWSEVEHDLVYKPSQGELSDEEYAILDEINGLVLSGEIALERLQKAGEQRAKFTRIFTNHYELAAYLYEKSKVTLGEIKEHGMGQVNLLFDLLQKVQINEPSKIDYYLNQLSMVTEESPLAQQIIDLILLEYPFLNEYIANKSVIKVESQDVPLSLMIVFMQYWYALEETLQKIVRLTSDKTPNVYSIRSRFINELKDKQILRAEDVISFQEILRERDQIVYKSRIPKIEVLNSIIEKIKNILRYIIQIDNVEIKKIVSDVLNNNNLGLA